MSIIVRDSDGTPVNTIAQGFVEVSVEQRLDDGTRVQRHIRIWVDREDRRVLKMDSDCKLMLQPVNDSRLKITMVEGKAP